MGLIVGFFSSWWSSRWALPMGLALIALGTVRALNGGFVTDDHVMIEDSPTGTGLVADLRATWTTGTLRSHPKSVRAGALDTYRPLSNTLYVLDRAVLKLHSVPCHAVLWVLHLANCLLLFTLASRMTGSRPQAWCATMLFGLHPTTSEAYLWLSSAPDLLMTFFLLSAAILLENPQGDASPGRSLSLFLLALLSCLSKEPAVLAILFLMVRPRASSVVGQPTWGWQHKKILFSLGAAAVAYAVLRLGALGGTGGPVSNPQHMLAAAGYVPLLWADAASSLVLPRHTAVRFLLEEWQQLAWIWQIWAYAIVIALFVALVFCVRRRPYLAWAMALSAALLTPVTLGLALGWLGFGRYLYLPAALIAPPLVASFTTGAAHSPLRRIGKILGVAYIVTFAVQLQAMIPAWRDDEAHFRAASEEFPERSHGWDGLGRVLMQKGDVTMGVTYLEKAVALNQGRRLEIWEVLIRAYADANRCDQVVKVARHLEEHYGDRRLPWHTIARCYLKRGEIEPGVRALLQGLQQQEQDAQLWELLHKALQQLGAPMRTELDKWLAKHADMPVAQRLVRELQ